MRVLVLAVLLATGLLPAELQELDLVQLSGVWYEVALAVQPAKHGAPQRPRRVGVVKMELLGSHFSLVSAYDNNLQHCVKEVTHARQSGPRQFQLQGKAGSKEVQILSTDYTSFAILEVTEQKGTNKVLKLYSRVLEPSEEALQSFYQNVEQSGLASTDVSLLLRDMTCVQLMGPGSVRSF
ncbi:epididymal-specific lipocalin-5-like [Sorex fumeus]|uniref:epididymal-specific lipocalin-5-like n=1 Tax=Sorex fumeus TaxID=62283 RepID=UPI0024AE8013|nr:epididymal-specific lipocalin-5-like [Sorex fumeus]